MITGKPISCTGRLNNGSSGLGAASTNVTANNQQPRMEEARVTRILERYNDKLVKLIIRRFFVYLESKRFNTFRREILGTIAVMKGRYIYLEGTEKFYN